MTRAVGGTLRSAGAVLAAVALMALAEAPATGHEERGVGDLEIVVGWLEEPPLAGFRNAAVLIATRSGEPVAGGRLQLVMIFGDENSDTRSDPVTLSPRAGFRGQYIAALIPTRPGRYTFEITGRIGGERINETFTSGPGGFEEVRSPAESQFPERDPTTAEIGTRLDRLDARVGQALAEIQTLSAESGPDTATLIVAGAGAALGALALAISLLRRPATGR